MKILIDADGCPVTDIAIEIAKKYNIDTIIFCDWSHQFKDKGVEVVTVSKGADSADFALVNRIVSGDIVVTQDYGLAAMALSKNGKPVTQNGMIITGFNIDTLLATRHMAKKVRMAGHHTKGPSKRKHEQDIAFKKKLTEMIENENIDSAGQL